MHSSITWQQAFADPQILGELIAEHGAGGYVAVLRQFGLRPNVHYYDRLRAACAKFGIPPPLYERPKRASSPKSTVPGKSTSTGRISAFNDPARIRAAVAYGNLSAACSYLGVKPCGGNYERLRSACAEHGIPVPAPWSRREGALLLVTPARPQTRVDPIRVVGVARAGMSLNEACSHLGLPVNRYQRERLSRIARDADVVFKRKPRRDLSSYRPKTSLLEMLEQGVPISQGQLKYRLVAEGILPYRCSTSQCPITDMWLGQPITLHLDHVNGDPTDNRLENLRFLCPNCHSQTPTYNRGKGRRGGRLLAATA